MSIPGKISPVSLFAVRLEQRRSGRTIGYGTGFVYHHALAKRRFLVTNYHVLTARDPRNPSMLEPGYPDSPDELVWSALTKPNFVARSGGLSIGADAQFIEHRRRADGVDLAAIAISFPEDTLVVEHDRLDCDNSIEIQVGMEVFIVGFPHGFGIHDLFPVWKRGTIASEPLLKEDGMSRFLVDAFSHPGMSGAPVFAVARRQMVRLGRESAQLFSAHEKGELSALDFIKNLDVSELQSGGFDGMALRLIGIYSGRLTLPHNKDPNLGIVYGTELLDELFNDPVVVPHPFPPT